jgi:uncharacterized membrane protein
LEKENKFVRFHALQSVLTGLSCIVLGSVLGLLGGVPILRFFAGILGKMLTVVAFVVYVVLMFKAWQKEVFKLPIIGDAAEKQIGL